MSQHRYRAPRNRALLALVVAAGIAFGLMAIGLISGLVTGLVLLAQIVSDFTHGY